MLKIKRFWEKSKKSLSVLGIGLGSLLGANVASAQTYDITANATTTAAVEPIATFFTTNIGQAVAFVVTLFMSVWYWILLIGGIFWVINYLRNTGQHK